VVVRAGRRTPKGFLPVFSVDTLKEAQALIVLTCQTDLGGTHFAAELAQEQNFINLGAYSDKLAKAHELLKSKGKCTCK
jgi:hypothetical protein